MGHLCSQTATALMQACTFRGTSAQVTQRVGWRCERHCIKPALKPVTGRAETASSAQNEHSSGPGAQHTTTGCEHTHPPSSRPADKPDQLWAQSDATQVDARKPALRPVS